METWSARKAAYNVSAHRVPHLRRCQTIEVGVVRLRVLRLVSAAPCKQIQKNLYGLIEKLPYSYNVVTPHDSFRTGLKKLHSRSTL